MAIMDMFRTKPAVDPSQTQQMQPTGPVIPASVAANPLTPGGEAISDGKGPAAFPKAGEGAASPLENFADLWQTSDKDKLLKSPVPAMHADPAKLAEATKNIDFVSMIPQELQQKALGGDQKAMMDIINGVGQAGLAQAAAIATSITKDAVTQLTKNNEEQLKEILRRNTISSELRSENSLFDNPAAKPMLEMLERRFMEKYPTESAASINEMAKKYMSGFVELAAGTMGKEVRDIPVVPANRKQKNVDDWVKWASEV